MVKYIGVADDIIFANTGRKVDATHISISLKFDELDAELDLSDDTYNQIRETLMPVFMAYAAANPDVRLAVGNGTKELPPSAVTPKMRYTDSRKYKGALRVWAKKTGRLGEIRRNYFPVGLCDDFDAYLMRSRGLTELP
jgi:hypothetical protein